MDETFALHLVSALVVGLAPGASRAVLLEALRLLAWSALVAAGVFVVLPLAIACTRAIVPHHVVPNHVGSAAAIAPPVPWLRHVLALRRRLASMVARTGEMARRVASCVEPVARTGEAVAVGVGMLLLYAVTLAWHGATARTAGAAPGRWCGLHTGHGRAGMP